MTYLYAKEINISFSGVRCKFALEPTHNKREVYFSLDDLSCLLRACAYFILGTMIMLSALVPQYFSLLGA